MTDGPFRNSALSSRWKSYGEDLVNEATPLEECAASASHSILGGIAWDDLSSLLNALREGLEGAQLGLDPAGVASSIFDAHVPAPFHDSLQRHLEATIRESPQVDGLVDMALREAVNDLIDTAKSRIEEECIRSRDAGDMGWKKYEVAVRRNTETFNQIDAAALARAISSGARGAFKAALRKKTGTDEGPE